MQSIEMVRDSLAKISRMHRLNRSLYKSIESFLGERILEAGCGNGNIASFLKNRELVVAVDNDEQMLNMFKERLSENKNFKVIKFDLADPQITSLIKNDRMDTVICINTLEHIKKDSLALRNFYEILEANGRLILLIPALKFLYSSLDEAAGHFRRYNKKEIIYKLNQTNFLIEHISYFNLFGIIGWFLLGKVFKKREFSGNMLNLFDNLTKVFILLEKALRIPLGLSLLIVCNKNGRG